MSISAFLRGPQGSEITPLQLAVRISSSRIALIWVACHSGSVCLELELPGEQRGCPSGCFLLEGTCLKVRS